GINYRMHPANVGCLTAAGTNCCTLANNHVLDWGEAGLAETLEALQGAGLRTAGAGRNRGAAQAPAVLALGGGGRVLVYSLGTADSGIPASWEADAARPGVDFLHDLSEASAQRLAERVRGARRERDLVVLSIHWGGNWWRCVAGGCGSSARPKSTVDGCAAYSTRKASASAPLSRCRREAASSLRAGRAHDSGTNFARASSAQSTTSVESAPPTSKETP